MKFKRILAAYLALVVGLFLAATLPGAMVALVAGLPPTRTPQDVTQALYISPPGLGVQPLSQQVTATHVQLDLPGVTPSSIRPEALTSDGTGWRKIMAEDFEGTFPPSGWTVTDTSPIDGGEYLWGQRDCKNLSGSYSLWAGGGGADGELLDCNDTYPDNLRTRLTYGPIDLTQATDAELQFFLWTDVEGNGAEVIDQVFWGARRGGDARLAGYSTAGQTGDWIPEFLNLTDVPYYGDITGGPEVYLGWSFASNESNPARYKGAFIDDVALWVYTDPPPTPMPIPPALPITCHTTLTDFAGGSSPGRMVVGVQEGDGALTLAEQVNVLGNWERLPSLPRELFLFATVAAKGHLFVIGGNSPEDGYQRRVYSAAIQGDGLLGHWVELTELPQALACHAAVVANDHLFALGGYNANGFQATAFSAPVNDDGTLGMWSTLPEMPGPLGMFPAVSTHGYIYVLGGRISDDPVTVSDKIYRARANANGTLGGWETLQTRLPRPSQHHEAIAACNHIYLIGGNDDIYEWRYVWQAEIQADGSLGMWGETTLIPETLSRHAAVALPGGILVTGGWHSSDPVLASQKCVYWAPLDHDCNLGDWVKLVSLPYGVSIHSLAAADRHIYNLGGVNSAPRYFGSVLMAPLQFGDHSVQRGTFNHQFRLGDNYAIKSLRWIEEGSDDTQIHLRYRVGDADTGAYGPWSDYTSTSPVPINATGGFLEYELWFAGGNGLSDEYVTEVSLSVTPLHPVYLPLVIKD